MSLYKNNEINQTFYFQVFLLGFLANRFFFSGGVCKSKNRVDDKVVIVTGANTGVGFETALELAKRGARVIMGCHDLKDAEKAAV